MNRRLFALLLVALMLLCCGCKSQNIPTEEETFSGVEDNIWFDEEPTVESIVESSEMEIDDSTKQTEANHSQNIDVTEPVESEPQTSSGDDVTVPSTEVTEETVPPAPPAHGTTEYEWYHALSGEEQEAYMESFDSMKAFFDWYNAAKAEYDALHPDIEIDDGVIDLEDLVGGNG